MNKEEKVFHIALCLFALEDSKGHLQWKVTELVRKSKVSRPLIYRYFGSSREEILKTALHVFCDEFYGFTPKTKAFEFVNLVKDAREKMQTYPEAVLFYQKWRGRDSVLKDVFIKVEMKFRKKLKKFFPDLDDAQILMAHTCIHGLVTAPFLSPDQTEQVCALLAQKGVF